MKLQGLNQFVSFLKLKGLIYIFGTGKAGMELAKFLGICGIPVAGFLDNNVRNQKTNVLGQMVYNPEMIKEMKEPFYLLIASSFFVEIESQLIEYGQRPMLDFVNVMPLIMDGFFPRRQNPMNPYVDDLDQLYVELSKCRERIASNASWDEVVKSPFASSHGERYAEYPFLMQWFRDHQPQEILDVGCVLNNRNINPSISSASKLSFLNPAKETLIRQDADYYVMPLQDASLGKTFDLVTCLSTIEHFGMDNSRYGFDSFDLGWDWNRCIEEFLNAIHSLYELTSPGGTLIVSCPYGQKEFVIMPPIVGVRTAQVIHAEHIEAFQERFGHLNNQIHLLRLTGDGWIPSVIQDDYESYGTIGPGASGLIILQIQK